MLEGIAAAYQGVIGIYCEVRDFVKPRVRGFFYGEEDNSHLIKVIESGGENDRDSPIGKKYVNGESRRLSFGKKNFRI